MECEEICSLPRNRVAKSGSFKELSREFGCPQEPPVIGTVSCRECVCCDGKKVELEIICNVNKCVAIVYEGESVLPDVLSVGGSALYSLLSLVSAVKSGKIEGILEIGTNVGSILQNADIEAIKKVLIECAGERKKKGLDVEEDR